MTFAGDADGWPDGPGVLDAVGVGLGTRLVVEPSGALAVAALAFRSAEIGLVGLGRPVVAVVSGGNVDPDRYRELLLSPLPPRG